MSLRALVFCSDEKTLRVLRRVLSELEIQVEHCPQTDSAINKLTRQRFEAIVVDCSEAHAASQVLRSAQSAPCNKRAVTVAIIDAEQAANSAFERGAHFVLHKPLVLEQTKSSFRAVRALMKRERRRNLRLPVQIPVILIAENNSAQFGAITTDIGEGGMAIQAPRYPKGAMRICFDLPGIETTIECNGEIAWENGEQQAGIRFVNVAPEMHAHLKIWLNQNSPEMEKSDPPSPCKLTDLSPGGCYLETSAPFPVRTKVILTLKAADVSVQLDGMVRVMHPDMGMGVEFTQNATQQALLEKFIYALTTTKGAVPELFVEPEGLENTDSEWDVATQEFADPLLELFHKKVGLDTESFLVELRRQRGQPQATV